jgi:hypothetical protein
MTPSIEFEGTRLTDDDLWMLQNLFVHYPTATPHLNYDVFGHVGRHVA